MNARILGLALLAGLAVCSEASFELLLALDKGNGSTSGRIHRYDGDTGTYLGFFGQGWVNSTSVMAIDQTRNELYVTTGTVLRTFDYNTGELKRSFSLGFPVSSLTAAPNGGIYMTSANLSIAHQITRFDPVTNSTLGTFSLPTPGGGIAPLLVAVAARTGSIVAVDIANDRVFESTNGGASWASTTSGLIATMTGSEQGIASTNQWSDSYFSNAGSSGWNVWLGSFITFSIPGCTGSTGMAVGHQGTSYILHKTASGAAIAKMDRYIVLGPTFSAPHVVNPGYLCSVVAPEPGTMAALGLGLLAILRKARR